MRETREVVRGRSPGAGWSRVAWGLHRRGGPSPSADLAACAELLPRLAAFTHLTSARARGWWLPPLPEPLPFWAAQITSQNASERAGLIVSRHRAIPESELVDGIRLALPGETLLACARDLGLVDLVVLVDCVLQRREASYAELARVARQHRRGAPRLREALALADGRAESPWETLLRLLHVVSGIGVEPQRVLRDEDGAFVARADLLLTGSRVLHEYDGAQHLERAEQRRDLERDRRLERAGYRRHGYTREDVLHQGVLILRDADAAVGRPHDPGRITRWHDLLRESLFTPAGTARFRARLGRAAGSG
ncbi:hypothetical protein [Nocardioides pantholopis]|uniref:hypothetical protein n=1 Tax=Nocardioides pantholopis TaxID=2483798 RepID=UPI000FD7A5AD|nr:hypothetical protein [Nocardioides pantholopis]